jgi:hypothetical protein
MASPYSFHERAEPLSDTVGLKLLNRTLRAPRPTRRAPRAARHVPRLAHSVPPVVPSRPARRALASRAPLVAPRAYAFCPLAVSLDSMVKIAS